MATSDLGESIPIDHAREFRIREADRLGGRHGTIAEVFRIMKETFGVV